MSHRGPLCKLMQQSPTPTITHSDVLVIGGGPAGMMAALIAAERGRSVRLLEKNPRVGEKLSITGGGRCNISNDEPDVRKLLSHYGNAEDFLYAAFARFGQKETVEFFTSRGLPLVTQARQRMFPASERAYDVTAFFGREMQKAGVHVEHRAAVSKLEIENGRIKEVITLDGRRWSADSVILATGGVSRPETGSSGEGFDWLRELGHTVKSPNPSIVPLRSSAAWIPPLSGVSLSFMKISFFSNGKRAFTKLGKLLFTHFGISGPLILNSAYQVGELLEAGPVTAQIDLYPDTEFDALDRRVMAAFDANKNKDFKNILPDLVPAGMSDTMLLLSKIAPETKVHSVRAEERRLLIHLLKELPLEIEGLMGMDRAVVSDGGVSLEEVDTRTFNSKKISNLYLVGDTLNINRPSGGYSLQLCWTSGFIAGSNA